MTLYTLSWKDRDGVPQSLNTHTIDTVEVQSAKLDALGIWATIKTTETHN